MHPFCVFTHYKFQSTQPEWAATKHICPEGYVTLYISIHAARVGCDLVHPFCVFTHYKFQSTQPEWAATDIRKCREKIQRNFNPRSPSGLRPDSPTGDTMSAKISIHAARVGCDWKNKKEISRYIHFNPRSPSGLRPGEITVDQFCEAFQSTQPEWAATEAERKVRGFGRYFNPRSPSGLRQEGRVNK